MAMKAGKFFICREFPPPTLDDVLTPESNEEEDDMYDEEEEEEEDEIQEQKPNEQTVTECNVKNEADSTELEVGEQQNKEEG